MKAESRRAADNPRKRIVNMGPHANVSYYLSSHGAVWSSPLLHLCGDPIPRPSATPPLLQEPRGGRHSGVNSHSVMDPSLPLSGHKESGNCIDGGKEYPSFLQYVGGGPVPQSGSALSIPEALGVVGVVLPDSSPVIMVPSPKYPLPALEFIQVLQSSGLPGGVVSIITGGRDQLTQALANHSVIKAIWYWGSMKGCQFLKHMCSSPLKSLWLHCQEEDGGRDWAQPHPSLLEEMWRQAVQWKSVWIPTA
ncbi:aldehyde dehydrogenase family 16 member A1-like [Salmo salar]|uniref:Aldehyde dehydrogenase family 16 member A1-like n=1 Tax=Salmo salar TaxID=8030 RepID=A0A1S3P8Z0_SALSA|nr:aldehyde dehydrogenase family 16 member A1-like [Salmo salar]|eukprot:XP_014024095.1 PREDICTED: aldehyde dehydrogenase family 16 member A1-like [Salmo salar]